MSVLQFVLRCDISVALMFFVHGGCSDNFTAIVCVCVQSSGHFLQIDG